MPRLVIELPTDRIKAGEAEIRRSLAAIGGDAKLLTSEVLRQERAMEAAGRRYGRLAGQLDPGIKKTQELARAQGILDAALRTGRIGQEEYNQRLAQARSQILGLTAATEKIRGEYQRLAASLDPSIARMQQLASAQQTLAAALRAGVIDQAEYNRLMGLAANTTQGFWAQLGALRSVIPAVFSAAALRGFVDGLKDAALLMERIERRFVAGAGGDRALGAAEFEFARTEAARLGLQLEATAGGYARLTAATRGTKLEGAATREIFSAVAEASATLGLSASDTEGVLRAVEQMISKGNVQAEELRGQLGERLPGAFQMAARAMNMTTAELNDHLKKGQVLAEDLLPKLAAAMHETYGEQAAQNVNTLSGGINALQSAWLDLKSAINEAGMHDTLIDLTKDATDAISLLSDGIDGLNSRLEQLDKGNTKQRFWAEMAREIRGVLTPMGLLVSLLEDFRELRGKAGETWDLFTSPSSAGSRGSEIKVAQIGAYDPSTLSPGLAPESLEEVGKGIEKTRQQTAALAKQYADLVKSMNPVRGAIERYNDGLELIRASGAPVAEQLTMITALYDELVERTATKRPKEIDFEEDVLDVRKVDAVLKQLLAGLGGTVDMAKEIEQITESALDQMGDEWIEANDAAAKHEEQVQQIKDGILQIGEALAEAFAGTQFGDAIASLTQIYDSIQAIRTATDQASRWNGYAGVAQGVYGLGVSTGMWGPKGGQSAYGGRKEGNYSAEGSTVGMIIGGIIGTMVGGQTQAGMAIGSAAGGILGSFIKKGADEALATMEFTVNEYALEISKSEAGLGTHIATMSQAIDEALGQALAALGGEITGGPAVSLKIRDDIVTVVVGAVKGKFEKMDDAISFAVAEILKQGQISGMSDTVRTAIANSTKDSLDSLLSDIDFAVSIDRIGMRPVEAAIEDYLAEYRAAVERATRLGLDTSKVGVGTAINLQNERNALLGIEENPAERIRRDAELFNARIQLLEAEETAKLADLKMKRAALAIELQIATAGQKNQSALLAARIHLVKQEAMALNNGLDIYGNYVENRAALMNLEATTFMESLAAIDAAIDASSALLENLPDLIDEGEISRAIARARSGGQNAAQEFGGHIKKFGGLTDRWRDGIRDFRDAVNDMRFNQSTTALTLREQSELAYADYQGLLSRARTGDVAALEGADDALRRFLEIYKSYTGGGEGFLGGFGSVFDRLMTEAEAFADAPRPARLRDGNVIFDRRFHENQREQIDEQRRHRAENREGLRAVAMAVNENTAQARELNAHLRREGRPYRVER